MFNNIKITGILLDLDDTLVDSRSSWKQGFKDTFKYHEHTKRPVELMSKIDVALRVKANEELSKIFYSGAKEKGKY